MLWREVLEEGKVFGAEARVRVLVDLRLDIFLVIRSLVDSHLFVGRPGHIEMKKREYLVQRDGGVGLIVVDQILRLDLASNSLLYPEKTITAKSRRHTRRGARGRSFIELIMGRTECRVRRQSFLQSGRIRIPGFPY